MPDKFEIKTNDKVWHKIEADSFEEAIRIFLLNPPINRVRRYSDHEIDLIKRNMPYSSYENNKYHGL